MIVRIGIDDIYFNNDNDIMVYNGICVIGLQLDFFHHSSLVPDCSVGS